MRNDGEDAPLDALASPLVCPHCATDLRVGEGCYRCANNHCFDRGKHGDVNLLLPQQKRSKHPGDSKAMVAARRDFLNRGAYQPIAELLAKTVTIVSSGEPCTIADAGCGEGYYLRNIQRLAFPNAEFFYREGEQFIGWDISKYAVQAAAKQASFACHWVTASNAAIPVADDSIDIVLSCFGFEVAQEFARIAKPRAHIITVDAGEQHLLEVRKLIYPELKPYRAKPPLAAENIRLLKENSLSYNVGVDSRQLSQLMLMTPHFFRATEAAKKRLAALENLSLHIDVVVRIYRVC